MSSIMNCGDMVLPMLGDLLEDTQDSTHLREVSSCFLFLSQARPISHNKDDDYKAKNTKDYQIGFERSKECDSIGSGIFPIS